MIGLAILLALFLDSPYCRGRKFFALVYFLPYAVPGVIAAIQWGFLLEPDLDSALSIPHHLGLTGGGRDTARLPVVPVRDHAHRHLGVHRLQHDYLVDEPDQRAPPGARGGQGRRLFGAVHRHPDQAPPHPPDHRLHRDPVRHRYFAAFQRTGHTQRDRGDRQQLHSRTRSFTTRLFPSATNSWRRLSPSSWRPSRSWPPLLSSASCGASWTPWPPPGGGERR